MKTAVTAVVLFFIGFLIGSFIERHSPIETIVLRDTTVVSDTVLIEQPPVVIEKPAIIRDTIVVRDSVEIETEVASLDTVLGEGELKIQYLVETREFEIEWNPQPIQLIKEIQYIPEARAWWDKPAYIYAAGVASTAILVALVK